MLRTLKSSLKHRRKHVLRSLQLYGDQALACIAWGILHVKEIASTMNFSATKRDLKIKIYGLEYTMLQMWLNSKWRAFLHTTYL